MFVDESIPMIELIDIRKQFGLTKVLDGLSMRVSVGSVSVLLGLSGSGKSTVLRTINGLESFDAGEVHVGEIVLHAGMGRSRDRALQLIRRKVGMVFQQFHLFPHRTVIENVVEGAIHVLGQPRVKALATAEKLLAQVGMLGKANARPATLSGGQQQRVAIARTLAMGPEVILFDEPTSALDPEMTSEVTSVMVDLARSGQTMIVVTHDMEFARDVASQVFVLDSGKIVETNVPDQLFEHPKHDTTRRLLRKT